MKAFLKNIFIAILALLIIIGGYYFWNNSNTITIPFDITAE